MAYQVPMDLIERAQILLRKEAGLPNYNPTDPSFPALPSVEEVIAGFDPSPDSSRCQHCSGKLFRGSQSLICVYCAREPKRDCPPEPLPFKSTIACRWLLDSLGFDGSVENSLSEFLSKEMKWPVESERFGLFDADDFRNNGKGLLRLAGIDFNHSLSEEPEKFSSLPKVHTILNEKSMENDAWRSSSTDVNPSEDKIGNSFSAWEADFQAASSVAPVPHNDFESSQPLKLPEPSQSSKLPCDDNASHMDSVFGPLNDSEESTSIRDSSHIPPAIEENGTYYERNLISGLSSGTIMSSSTKIPGDDDSSDPWDSFTSLTGSGENKHFTSTVDAHKESISFENLSDFKSSGFLPGGQVANNGLDSAKDVSAVSDLFGPWDDVPNLKHSEERQEEVLDKLAVSVDTANHQDGASFMSELDDKVTGKDEYSSTMWDDFMDSTIPQYNPGDSNSVEFVGGWLEDEGGDTTDRWGNFTSLNSSQTEKEAYNTDTHDDIKIIKDETFDSLSNFVSSAGRHESNSGNKDMTQARKDISNSDDNRIAEDDKHDNSWSNFSSSNDAASDKLHGPTDPSVKNIEHSNQSSDEWSSTPQPWQNHIGPVDVPKNNTAKNEDVFNCWGDFSSTSVLQSIQQKNNEALSGPELFNEWSSRTSDSKATSEYQLKVCGESVPAITDISEVDDSFDAWSEFTSSTTLPSNSFQNLKESQVDCKQDSTGNDPFDAWSSLMTSSSSRSSNQNVSSEHVVETTRLNSSGNLKVPTVDSSLLPFLFSDAANDGNGSARTAISSSQVLDQFRMKDGQTELSIDRKQSQNDEPHLSGQMWKKPIDAETLISQMHDLSFMLESNLSDSNSVD